MIQSDRFAGAVGRIRARLIHVTSLIFSCVVLTLLVSIAAAGDDNSGPVRMARFANVSGSVTWHYGDDANWADAAINMPISQGAQVWTSDASRAEIQFDDGSRLRIDSNTLLTLQTLYSDDQGEYTEITLNNGSIHLFIKSQYSVFQVNTPAAALKAAGPARTRVSAGDGASFEVFSGSATVEGNGGGATLRRGDYLYLSGPSSPYNITDLPQPDDWDKYNAIRDARIDNPDRNPYLPSNIALVSDNLNRHGNWHRDTLYGWVWAPTVTDPDWRPYSAGSWVWVEPYGWTWVSTEQWGWAPYHYGSWIHADYGWGWVPGPANQYWCPAVVSFHQVNGGYAWVPLQPREVRYPPTLSLGFRGGNWSIFFSIGGAAVYYPGQGNVCIARPWSSSFINHSTPNHSFGRFDGDNHNSNVAGNAFVPGNARFGGGSFANSLEVRGGNSYQPVHASQAAMFLNGQTVGAPSGGQRPAMGPQNAHPGQTSGIPNGNFAPRPPIPQAAAVRTIFRAPLPSSVPQTQIIQSGQRIIAPSPNRVRPLPVPRDGSGFSTPLKTGGSGPVRPPVRSPNPPNNTPPTGNGNPLRGGGGPVRGNPPGGGGGSPIRGGGPPAGGGPVRGNLPAGGGPIRGGAPPSGGGPARGNPPAGGGPIRGGSPPSGGGPVRGNPPAGGGPIRGGAPPPKSGGNDKNNNGRGTPPGRSDGRQPG